jgi:hypothetical protein
VRKKPYLDWKYAYNFAKEIGRLNTLDDIQQQVRLTNNNSLIKEENYDKIASDRLGEELGSKVEVRSEMYDKIDGNTKVEDVEKARGESIGKEMDKAMGEWNYGKQDSQNMLKNNAQWLSQANNILYGNGGLTQGGINGYWNFKQNVSSSNIMFDNKIKSDVATKYGNGKYEGGKINIDGILDGAIDVASKNLASSLSESKFEYSEEESTYYSKLGKEKLGKTETWTTLNTAVNVFNGHYDALYTTMQGNKTLDESVGKKIMLDIAKGNVVRYDNYRSPLYGVDSNGNNVYANASYNVDNYGGWDVDSPKQALHNAGHIGANRDNGKRTHSGVDILANPGDVLISPADFEVITIKKQTSTNLNEKSQEYISFKYLDTSNNRDSSILNGDYTNQEKNIQGYNLLSFMYVDTESAKNLGIKVGQKIYAGEVIGVVNSLSNVYGKPLIGTPDHLHIQRSTGSSLNDVDPRYNFYVMQQNATSSLNYTNFGNSVNQINLIVPNFVNIKSSISQQQRDAQNNKIKEAQAKNGKNPHSGKVK